MKAHERSRSKKPKSGFRKIVKTSAILVAIAAVLIGVLRVPAQEAIIWTDKADYAPGQTVTIFGSGFNVQANVTVTINKPDGTGDTFYAVTDGAGNFTCEYLVNETLGTYNVAATDGTFTAKTTFTNTLDVIWTDKPDYMPEETVTIFGSNFMPQANVTVTIERPDGSRGTVYAVTDYLGNFTCTYQLDGIKGIYHVTATDGTNTATTAFSDGVVVDSTVTTTRATQTPLQRKSFYANGRFWVFYSDGTNMVYKTSTDGTTWTPTTANIVRSGSAPNGLQFSVWFDGTYVHYAYCNYTSGAAIFYRSGTPNSDGTITWSAAEQTAVAGISGSYGSINFAVDSAGQALIIYNNGSATIVTKNANTNGNWNTATGYPKTVVAANYNNIMIVPLTSGKYLCLYGASAGGGSLAMVAWNGTGWNAVKTTASSLDVNGAFWSAVNEGDDVHIVFTKQGKGVQYVRYFYSNNSLSAEQSIADTGLDNDSPVLSKTSTNDLYCFWARDNYVRYVNCVGGTWNTTVTQWQNDNIAPGSDYGFSKLTSFYQAYSGKIGVVYLTGSSPYSVRFAFLSVTVPAVTMTVSYQVTGGGTPTAPVFHYLDTTGSSQTYTLTTSTHDVTTVGAGMPWSVDNPLGSGSERWSINPTSLASGTAPSSGSTAIVFNYYHQYLLTVSGGNGVTYSLTSETGDNWYYSGDSLTVSSNGVYSRSSGTGQRVSSWKIDSGTATNVATAGTVTTSSISMSAAHTVTFASVTQWQVTLDGGATSALASITGPTITNDNYWYDSGASVTLSLNGVFGRGSGTGTRVTGYKINGGSNVPVSTTGTVTVLNALSIGSLQAITTTTVTQWQVTLDTGASAAKASLTSPTITGDNYWYDSGTSVTLTLNGVYGRGSGTGTRVTGYKINGGSNVPVSTTGTVTVLSSLSITSLQAITTTTVTQWQVTLDTGASAAKASLTSPTITGDNYWYDSGTSVTLTLNGVYGRGSGTGTRVTGYKINGGSNVPVSTTGTVTVLSSLSITSLQAITTTTVTQYFLTVVGGNSVAYGTASSITGDTGWYDTGASTTISSDWVWNVISGQSQTAITNYAIDGTNQNPTRQYSGTLTTASVSMTTFHTVTFASVAQYYLTFAVSPSSTGSINQANGYFDSGSQISITATPNSGYNFDHWSSSSGSITFTSSTSATTTATIGAYGTITANFFQIQSITSSDSSGTTKTSFVTSDIVYAHFIVSGSGSQAVNVYVVTSIPSAGGTLSDFRGSPTAVTVTSTQTTSIWNNPTTVGTYYLIMDGNKDGKYNTANDLVSSAFTIAVVRISQPITVTMSNTAPTATVTINGGNPSPITFSADGVSHSITMDQGASFTLSFSNSGSTRDGFNVAGSFSATSSSYTASTTSVIVTAYEQVQNTFSVTINGGNPLSGDTLMLTGTSVGSAANILTLSVGGTSSASSLAWSDYNTAVTFPATTTLSGTSERWAINGAYSTAALTGGGSTYSQTYYHQYKISAKYSTSDSSTPSASVVLSGTQFSSSSYQLTLTTSVQNPWLNAGTGWNVNNPIPSSPINERWYASSGTSGTISSSTSVNPTYFHQFLQTLSYSISGGGNPTAPTFTANQFGASLPQTLTGTATGYWFDYSSSSTAWSVTNPITGSSTEQWYTSQTTTGTITSAQTLAFTYNHQYTVSFAVSPPGDGTTNPTGTNVWENAGTPPLSISATPTTSYSFYQWTATGSITITNPNTASTTATISGSGTITATFILNSKTIIASAGSNGWISPSGSVSVTIGSNQAFTITPNAGYSIANVLVDGSSVGAVTTYTFNNVTADHTISATFSINTGAVRLGDTKPESSTASIENMIRGSRFTQVNSGTALSITAYLDVNTFGNSAGGTAGDSIVGNIKGSSFTCPVTGSVQTISAYVYCTYSDKTMKAAIYNRDTGALIASTLEITVTNTGSSYVQQLVTFNFAAPQSLTQGINYVLVAWSTGGTGGSGDLAYFGGGSPALGYSFSTSYGSWPTSLSFSSPNDQQFSIYATYTFGTSAHVKGAIYDDNHNLLAQTVEKIVSTSGWVCLDLTSNPSIAPNTYYTLVVWSESISGYVGIRYNPGATNQGHYLSYTYGSWPSNPAGFTHESVQYSIYLTFQQTTFTVTFSELWLPGGTTWGVTLGSVGTQYSTGDIIFNNVSPGSYSWNATSPIPGTTGIQYIPQGSPGTTTVSGNIQNVIQYLTQYYLTVNSAYGNPQGAGWYYSGTVPFNVSSPFSGGQGTQYVCTGYTGDASGSGTSGSIVMNGPKSVTFNWQTQYYLTVTSPYDTPAGSNWYNANVTAYATLSSGTVDYGNGTKRVFTGWIGDTSGTGLTSNGITMDGPKTATAGWKTQYLLTVETNGLPSPYTSAVSVGGSPMADDYGVSTINDASTLGWRKWFDASPSNTGTIGVDSPVAGATGTQYAFKDWTDGPAGNPHATLTLTGPVTLTVEYKTQFKVSFTETGLDSNASGTVVTIGGNAKTFTDLPLTDVWLDNGTTYSYESIVPAGSDKQFVRTGVTGPASPLAAYGTVNGAYKTQYNVTFSSSGVGVDFSGNVMTVGGTGYDRSGHSDWYDNGSSITFAYLSPLDVNSGKRYIYVSQNATSPLTVSMAETVMGTYKTQWYITVSSAHDSPTASSWVDNGSNFATSVSSPADVVSGDHQWVCTGCSIDGGASTPSTGYTFTSVQANHTIVFAWGEQFWIEVDSAHGAPTASAWVNASDNFNASVTSPADDNGLGTRYNCTGYTLDGNAPVTNGSASYEFVNVQSNHTIIFNWIAQYRLTVASAHDSPIPSVGNHWYNNGTQVDASVTSPADESAGTRYNCTGYSGTGSLSSGTGTSVGFNITAPSTLTWNWMTQYYLTVETSPSSVDSPTGGGWYDANTYAPISISEYANVTSSSRYNFTGWTTGNMTEITSPSSPSTTVLIDSAKTVTANYMTQYQITFGQTGVGVDFAGTVVTVDGANYTVGNLASAVFWWDDTSSHSFAFYSPLVVTSNGKQYIWDNTTGLSSAQTDASFVVSASGSVTGNYKIQYYLTVNSAHGTPSGSGWYDSGDTAYATVTPLTVAGPTGIQYVFTGWTIDASGSGSPSNGITMDGPKTATAGWQTQYELTVTSAHGSPTGAGWYNASDTANFGVTSPDGVSGTRYVFTAWSGDSTSTSASDSVVMSGPKAVAANWQTQYEVTFDVNPGGSGTTSPSGSGNWYDAGSSSNAISASAYSGYFFASWSNTGTIAIDDSASNSTTFTIDSSGTITAALTQTEYFLTVSLDPTGGGSVLANQSAPYHYGDVVNLTATANPGYSFSHWTGNLSGSSNPASIIIDDNKTVTAVFTQNTYTISVTVLPSSAAGSVIANKPGPYHYGDVVKLTETPAVGFSFLGWSGDGSGTGTTRTVNVTGDMTVTAAFGPAVFVVPENTVSDLLAFAACFAAFGVFCERNNLRKLRKNISLKVKQTQRGNSS